MWIMNMGCYPSISRRYATVLKSDQTLSAAITCRTLPVFLESVVLHIRHCCVYSFNCYNHLLTALCERHCKITKKFVKSMFSEYQKLCIHSTIHTVSDCYIDK